MDIKFKKTKIISGIFTASDVIRNSLYVILFQNPWITAKCTKKPTNNLLERRHIFQNAPNDLKQNGTQEKTPFSGTVFNTLSHGVIRFVASVSSKNHLLTG